MEIDREPVKSTSVASGGYDDLSATLEIEFRKASVYQYYDVPQRIYTELITASSLGEKLPELKRNVQSTIDKLQQA